MITKLKKEKYYQGKHYKKERKELHNLNRCMVIMKVFRTLSKKEKICFVMVIKIKIKQFHSYYYRKKLIYYQAVLYLR